MARSTVAIIGRPNVGKSTLFNRLVGHRVAIEDPTSGVTRDRLLHKVTVKDVTFDLIDTGGIGIVDRQDLSGDVEAQIDLAINAADALIFLVDCRDGVTPLDQRVATRVRELNKPFIFAANKADTDTIESDSVSFFELGLGEVLPISAHQGRGMDALFDRIVDILPPSEPEPEYDDDVLKLAFLGKRNAGKSSLINNLAGSERVIVSSTPGTTRDAVDVLFERDGKRFVAIDTAGLRKRGRMDDAIEFYGHVRAEKAIDRTDAVIFVIDASTPISKVDKRLGNRIAEAYKPCVLAINKWDLAVEARPDISPESYHDYLLKSMPGLWYAPLAATSALTGENVWNLVTVARELVEQARKQVGTGVLNRALQEAYDRRRPKPVKNRLGKIYYGTQTGTEPPSFSVFCNNPGLFDDQYTRYLVTFLRENLGFEEVPLSIKYRSSHERKD